MSLRPFRLASRVECVGKLSCSEDSFAGVLLDRLFAHSVQKCQVVLRLCLCKASGLKYAGTAVTVEQQRHLLFFGCDRSQRGYDEFHFAVLGGQGYGAPRALWTVDNDSGRGVPPLSLTEDIATERQEKLLRNWHRVSVMK